MAQPAATAASSSDNTIPAVVVHVGAGNLEDVLQAEHACKMAPPGAIKVIRHDTFHHNIPMFLEREQKLVPLFKRELMELLLLPQQGTTQKGA